MELRGKGYFRLFKCVNGKKKSGSNSSRIHALESMVSKTNGGRVVSYVEEDNKGVVRMKLVVKKSELKQLVESMNAGQDRTMSSSSSSYLTAEERLNHLVRKKKHASYRTKPCKCWSPALQSIPEEFSAYY
ncbi:hypothetical protein HN51_056591 [Arachis hypogaea]|uniref:Uncharacterized protein n=1 Tax=Arachis hypogaea TaxID=3818 RepID=A0A6B9VGC5_ARAHY|nr:uncharacterized protein DS421_19g670450 [Arachis hypogaea]